MKLTQEQLAELIAKVFTNIDEKRKARKENGEDIPDTISNEEILTEVDAILSELDNENTEPTINEKATEPAENNTADENSDKNGETIPITPELISQIIENLNKTSSNNTIGEEKKSANFTSTRQAKNEPQRKYTSLFLSNGANRDGNRQQKGFKSRIATMPAPERRKAAYGMFGRAVKCIHASSGDVEKAAFTAEHKFNDAEMAHEFKALSTISPANGAILFLKYMPMKSLSYYTLQL